MSGYVQLSRSPATIEMAAEDPKAFLLLTIIALRARYGNETFRGDVKIGEAFIGDYKKCGFTRKEYECAVSRLEKQGHIRDIKRGNKGTVVTLCSPIFWINEEQSRVHQKGQIRDTEGASRGHQGGTKETRKQENRKTECAAAAPETPSADENLASLVAAVMGARTDIPWREAVVMNTLRICPEYTRAQAVREFTDDLACMIEPPDNPAGMLRGYMRRGADGPPSSFTERRGASAGEISDAEIQFKFN